MRPFRLGLVGAGRMGQTHLRALAESERVRVVSIAETSPANRAAASMPGVSVHANVDAMIKGGGIDGALVAVPSPLHVITVEQLAAAGLPILCEKPCGITAEDARTAAAIVAKSGVLLQVAYWRRFVPALKQLKDRITAGDLGELYLVSCWQWDQQPPSAVFRNSSGGIFIDMGVHEFDQMRWLTGQEFINLRVSASKAASDISVEGDPESAQVLCDLSGGCCGLVSLGRRFSPGDACWAQVFGTKMAEECRFLWPTDGDGAFTAALRLQAESFADAVRGKPGEGATAEDAVAALTAAEHASMAFRGTQSPGG